MGRRVRALALGAVLVGAALTSGGAWAVEGDSQNGEAIYFERCVGCHGEDGDGLGPAADRLNPPPRDFTFGEYKFRTTYFDDFVPNDQDLFRMIADGMPGTGMPGWSDVLSEQEMWDLIQFIFELSGLDEMEPELQVDRGTQVATSAESIARGRELFHDGDRCVECHGVDGKGNGSKRLKDDNGDRTWPRNLTKPWTFRASNDPADIFLRISVGIPTTQMPSFADPDSNKVLTIEERWDVANYVASLAKTEEVVRPDRTVINVTKIDGDLPTQGNDPAWQEAVAVTFLLVPQVMADERFFTPSNDTITVRGLFNGGEIALLLEWDDRTKSIPGDEDAEKIADEPIGEDRVAVQLPARIPEGMEKPYFLMGDATHPVNFLRWNGGTTETLESAEYLLARGMDDVDARDAVLAGFTATGAYDEGTWRVVMRRSLLTDDVATDLQFVEGRFIPVAFAAWDGSNSESGSRHTITTWYWLLLEPPATSTPVLSAIGVAAIVGFLLIAWARRASPRREED